MGKTLHDILLEMGWVHTKGSEYPIYRFYLFGLTITRIFHLEELIRTGSEAEKIAQYSTEKAMYDLVHMMYEALYNNARGKHESVSSHDPF